MSTPQPVALERAAARPRAIPRFWPDAAVALSLANLWYLRVWSELLTYSSADAYTMRRPPSPADLLATVLNVIVVGALLWPLVTLARRHRWARWAFLVSLIVPLNALRAVLSNHFPMLKSPLLGLLGPRGVELLAAGLAALGVMLIVFLSKPLARATSALLLPLAAFVPLTFAQAAWKAMQYDAAPFRDLPSAPPVVNAKAAPRVLWIILDEWDQRLTFDKRAPGLALPEIDRFRAGSIHAANAYSPGPDTAHSMPSLITGRRVAEYATAGPSTLLLRFDGSDEKVSWAAQPNVFLKAREAGFNTALVGWYHPYCRVIHASLTACEWWPMAQQYNSMGSGLEMIPGQTRSLFETSLFSLFGQSLTTHEQARTYRAMLERAREIVVHPEYGLTLVHLPVPHPPPFYNLKTGRDDLGNSPLAGYAGSLKAADIALGELRRAMERAGLWDQTTILLSSDHSYRGAPALDGILDRRVPFLLKLADQHEGIAFDRRFNTILSAGLILSILRGEIGSPEAAAAWVDQQTVE